VDAVVLKLKLKRRVTPIAKKCFVHVVEWLIISISMIMQTLILGVEVFFDKHPRVD